MGDQLFFNGGWMYYVYIDPFWSLYYILYIEKERKQKRRWETVDNNPTTTRFTIGSSLFFFFRISIYPQERYTQQPNGLLKNEENPLMVYIFRLLLLLLLL
jgi:hypothetical protein